MSQCYRLGLLIRDTTSVDTSVAPGMSRVARMASIFMHDREPRTPSHEIGHYLKSTISGNIVAFEEGEVMTLNTSRHGMLLLMHRSFEPGDIIEVKFQQVTTTVLVGQGLLARDPVLDVFVSAVVVSFRADPCS